MSLPGSEEFQFIVFFSTGLYCLYEPHHEKNNALVSDLVRHKPGCAATEDG